MRMLVDFIRVRMKMKNLFETMFEKAFNCVWLTKSSMSIFIFFQGCWLVLKLFLKMQKVNIKTVACDEFCSIYQKITFTFLYLIRRASLRQVRSQDFLKGGAKSCIVVWAQDRWVKSCEYFCSFGLKTSNFRLNFMLSRLFYNLSTTIKYFSFSFVYAFLWKKGVCT